jgi:hypothetical protein
MEISLLNLNLKLKTLVLLTVYIISNSVIGFAEDLPLENVEPAITQEDIEKGFANKTGIQALDQQRMDEDKLKLGGFIRQEYRHYQLSQNGVNELFQCPSTLGLYFDANFNNSVRALFRGHFINDAAIDETLPSSVSLLGQNNRNTSQLEEMKLQFQSANQLFYTLGVQKIKWGSGKFWNPSDFLNSEKRNLLRNEDERQGLNLIKLHLPYDRSNFYMLANFENANDTKSVGGALRAEFAFNAAEFSFTHYSRKNSPSLNGFDASFALGEFDIIFEGATSSSSNKEVAVAGISWDWQYSENNYLNLSLEGIWNEAGVSDASSYLALLQGGQFTPFNVAKAYQLLSIYIPKPGKLINSNLQFLAIRNQMDKSIYNRLIYFWTGIRDITLSGSISTRQGNKDSEMKLAGLSEEYGIEASIKF